VLEDERCSCTIEGIGVTAAVTHVVHPTPTFDIWFWQSGPSEFQEWQSSDPPWWQAYPVPTACFEAATEAEQDKQAVTPACPS
jgi:hypothetical protein